MRNPYIFTPLSILVTLFAIRVFGFAIPIHTTSTTMTTSEFSMVGEGKVDVVPDIAYVDVGVVVNKAASADVAQKRVDEVHNAIVAAVKQLGITAEDVKTTNYNVNPNYDYTDGKNQIAGYNGNATISIKVVDKTITGKVTQAAVAAGANEVQNTRFVVAHPEKYREMARDKAIENAKDQAEKLAKKLGSRLGAITNISESGDEGSRPMPIYAMKSAMDAGGPPVDLQPGQESITSRVTLYFEKR